MENSREIYLQQKLGRVVGFNRDASETTLGADFLHFLKQEHPEDHDFYFEKLSNLKLK